MRLTTSTLLLAAWLAASQYAAGQGPNGIGPAVGERVPDFELRDQGGVSRTLSSLLGPRGAMLVFYRSADW